MKNNPYHHQIIIPKSCSYSQSPLNTAKQTMNSPNQWRIISNTKPLSRILLRTYNTALNSTSTMSVPSSINATRNNNSNTTSIIFDRQTSSLLERNTFTPADPLPNRKKIESTNPKLGKMKLYIPLPVFISNDEKAKFEYKPSPKFDRDLNERQYEINTYINTRVMMSKLIYNKTKLNKEGLIDWDNIVSLHNNQTSSESSPAVNWKPYYMLKSNWDTTLQFESRFECGNLQCAFKAEETPFITQYQLVLQNDSNTTGYNQWFFYSVSNTKKGQKVNFNMINLKRKKSLYSNGFKIWSYSTKKAQRECVGWHRVGDNVMYYNNNWYMSVSGSKRNLYSLTFDYEFKYDNDTVFFANSLPFTYTTMMREWSEYQLNPAISDMIYRKTIGRTLLGNDVDLLSINENNSAYFNNIRDDKRKGIVLLARQHPGETVGSHVIQGAIEFLLSNCDEAKKLREWYVIKIIPMLNPDGVIWGNSRTSWSGCDWNRRWKNTDEQWHPEIHKVKEMISKFSAQREISFIVDFHGHTGAFNSFFYCNYKESKHLCSLFPFICSKISKIISYDQSKFSMPKYKNGTGRLHWFNEMLLNNIVAWETSYFGVTRDGEYNRNYLTSSMLKEIGRDVCLGMLSYYYKYENTVIEKDLLKSNECLNIDINEFNAQIKREENAREDVERSKHKDNGSKWHAIENLDEESESEPSIDNFESDKICKILFTKKGKRRKKSKNNLVKHLFKSSSASKTQWKNKNNLANNEMWLFNPLKYWTDTQKRGWIKVKSQNEIPIHRSKDKAKSKVSINCFKKPNPTNINIPENIWTNIKRRKNVGVQTEEIFFKMHWVFFACDYKVIKPTVAITMNFEKNNIIWAHRTRANQNFNLSGNKMWLKNKSMPNISRNLPRNTFLVTGEMRTELNKMLKISDGREASKQSTNTNTKQISILTKELNYI